MNASWVHISIFQGWINNNVGIIRDIKVMRMQWFIKLYIESPITYFFFCRFRMSSNTPTVVEILAWFVFGTSRLKQNQRGDVKMSSASATYFQGIQIRSSRIHSRMMSEWHQHLPNVKSVSMRLLNRLMNPNGLYTHCFCLPAMLSPRWLMLKSSKLMMIEIEFGSIR